MLHYNGKIEHPPCSSATFMRNWLRSFRTRLRPSAMKSSNRCVNFAMRSRNSSNPKLMLGRLSAVDSADVAERGTRIVVERDGSKRVAILTTKEMFKLCSSHEVLCCDLITSTLLLNVLNYMKNKSNVVDLCLLRLKSEARALYSCRSKFWPSTFPEASTGS